MASSIAAMTMPRSIDFSRATASAICNSSSLLALTAIAEDSSFVRLSGSGLGGLLGLLQTPLFLLRLAQFALGGLLGAQGFAHQFVGENELCFAHVRDRQQHCRVFPCFRVVPRQARIVALDAVEN